MKPVLHRAAPPVLKDVSSDKSVGRTLWGFIVFAVLVIGGTFVVMTHELVIAAVTVALVAYCAAELNARIRMPSGKK